MIAAVLLLISTVVPLPDGGEVIAVTVDGGEVPTVKPGLIPGLAPLLAPELVPDGGSPVIVVPATLSVYNVHFPAELGLTGTAIGLAVVVDLLVKPGLEGDVSCRTQMGGGRCNPKDLTAFDRYAVGRKAHEWSMFSDVALYASILLPTIYLGLESIELPTTDPLGDWANDLLVVSEAMALSAAMQIVFKFAFRRPRPARYLPATTAVASFDQELSFPSGHVTLVAAATTALSTTIFLRHPDSNIRYFILGSGLLLTGLTAIARVEGGHHFPTDVLVGALVGSFCGFVVPWLHRKKAPRIVPTAMFNPLDGSATLSVSGAF